MDYTKDKNTASARRYNMAKNTYMMLKKTLSQMDPDSSSYETVLEEVASAKNNMESIWKEIKENEECELEEKTPTECKCDMFLVHFPSEFGIDPSLVRSVTYVDGNIDSFVITFVDTVYNGMPPYELYKRIKGHRLPIDIVIEKLEPTKKTPIYKETHVRCIVGDFKYCTFATSLDYEYGSVLTFSINFHSANTYQKIE